MADGCPVCRQPSADPYAPWCSRGCKAFDGRRAGVNYDVVAERAATLTSSELRGARHLLKLRTETLRKTQIELAKQREEGQRLTAALAYAQERIAVLEWYGGDAVVRVATAELQRRRREGRKAGDFGADAVLALPREARA